MSTITPPPPEPPLLVDSREAARLLACCERTLWGLTRDGKLPAIRMGRAVRYSRATLLEYIRTAEGRA